MPGNRVNGPLCSTTSPAIDTGTNALTRIASSNSTCLFRGTPSRKAGSGRPGVKSAHVIRLMIHKARADAGALLTARLGEVDAWDKDCLRRAGGVGKSEPLTQQIEATRKLFFGWFGTVDALARSTVRKRIVKAIDKLKALHDSDFLPDWSSTDVAYVYDGTTERGKYERTVHIGSAFWADDTDDKTRAGTLIHELSHFHSVGSTDDVGHSPRDQNVTDFPGIDLAKIDRKTDPYTAYGGARAARLAIRSPEKALQNADNFEFFIEGREASVILDEKGKLDTEGVGDFPNMSGNSG